MSFQDRLKECPRGTKMRISAECGITHGAVSQWDVVPAERVLVVERITGIPRHEIRPDIYPPPTSELAETASADRNAVPGEGGSEPDQAGQVAA